MPDPTESRISPVFPSKTETLGGKSRREVLGRKYKYDIRWNFMTSIDYNSLETLVNVGNPVTLTYNKYPQSQDGVSVEAQISERTHIAMVGNDFYSDVSLTLTEVSNRL
jgi:hypothetical protein